MFEIGVIIAIVLAVVSVVIAISAPYDSGPDLSPTEDMASVKERLQRNERIRELEGRVKYNNLRIKSFERMIRNENKPTYSLRVMYEDTSLDRIYDDVVSHDDDASFSFRGGLITAVGGNTLKIYRKGDEEDKPSIALESSLIIGTEVIRKEVD